METVKNFALGLFASVLLWIGFSIGLVVLANSSLVPWLALAPLSFAQGAYLVLMLIGIRLVWRFFDKPQIAVTNLMLPKPDQTPKEEVTNA